MHARRRHHLPKWVSTLLVAAFVLTTPLWIPVALAWHAIGKHRLRQAAKSFACVRCGRLLGLGALKLADRICAEQAAELSRQHPGVRLRVRTLDAICTGCGARYTFRAKECTFVMEDSLTSDTRA